jgi:hypothetical protein
MQQLLIRPSYPQGVVSEMQPKDLWASTLKTARAPYKLLIPYFELFGYFCYPSIIDSHITPSHHQSHRLREAPWFLISEIWK